MDALKRVHHFQADPDVPFFIWIRTIATQQLIQTHRHHLGAGMRDAGRETAQGRLGGPEAGSEKMADLMGNLTSPSHAVHRGEIVDRLRSTLEALDPLDREILALRHFEDLSNQEIATLLGMMEQLRRKTRPSQFAPERFGEYRVLRELGRGGMGVVYEAIQESLWRHVAVKTLHHSHLDPLRLKRFQREPQAVAQLHHTNIVPIFGMGEQDGLPYFVLQYIKGKGLDIQVREWRREGIGRESDRWRKAARIGIQAAEALDHAHTKGILHRDIKPSNLLIDEDETTWITDFGPAKFAGNEDLTSSGDVIGTIRYLAPEALRGVFDLRGDL